MKHIKYVFLFELKSILSKKSIKVTTIIFAIVFFLGTSVPVVVNLFSTDDPTDIGFTPEVTLELTGFYLQDNSVESLTFVELGGRIYSSANQLKSDVEKQELNAGFIITSPTSFDSIVLDRTWTIAEVNIVSSILRSNQINKNLQEVDLNPILVNEAMNVTIDFNEIVLGKDASSSYYLTFTLMFAVYMLVIMYGSFVSTSVAREKDNRTMEILITATKPYTLIIGKVFANGVAGLAQFGFVALAGVLGFLINQSSYPEGTAEMLFSGLTPGGLMIFLLFTIFGYILYLFIYASLGSLVSKIEDVSSSVTPVTLLFIVAYAVSAIGMEIPSSIVVRIASFVPFTSILAMPVRNFQMSVPWYEISISLVLMLLTTIFFAYVSIKIYRMGSLNYGNKIKLSKAFKMVFSKEE